MLKSFKFKAKTQSLADMQADLFYSSFNAKPPPSRARRGRKLYFISTPNTAQCGNRYGLVDGDTLLNFMPFNLARNLRLNGSFVLTEIEQRNGAVARVRAYYRAYMIY